MKLSEYLMAKALQHDDFELTKIAYDIYATEDDSDMLTKEAIAPILGGLARVGSGLLKNKIIKNTAISAGVGAVSGAANAGEGNRLSGALKGGLVGGALGGATTAGFGVAKAMRNGATLSQGMASQARGVGRSFESIGKNYRKGFATAEQAANKAAKGAPKPNQTKPQPQPQPQAQPQPSASTTFQPSNLSSQLHSQTSTTALPSGKKFYQQNVSDLYNVGKDRVQNMLAAGTSAVKNVGNQVMGHVKSLAEVGKDTVQRGLDSWKRFARGEQVPLRNTLKSAQPIQGMLQSTAPNTPNLQSFNVQYAGGM